MTTQATYDPASFVPAVQAQMDAMIRERNDLVDKVEAKRQAVQRMEEAMSRLRNRIDGLGKYLSYTDPAGPDLMDELDPDSVRLPDEPFKPVSLADDADE